MGGSCVLINRKPIGTVGFMSGIDFTPTDNWHCTLDMAIYNERCLLEDNQDISYVFVPYSYHAKARNEIAQKRIGDWTLQLDLDLIFRPDTLELLLRTMEVCDPPMDVVCGVYYKGEEPHHPVIFQDSPEAPWFEHVREIPDRPFQITGGGGGCMLIRNSVFDRIEEMLGEEPFDPMFFPEQKKGLSEDLSFFRRCQQIGAKVWCDPLVDCGHLRYSAIGWKNYEGCRERVQEQVNAVTVNGDKVVLDAP